MAGTTGDSGGWRGSRWRTVVWGLAALVLALPLFAMQVSDEVRWGAGDFVLFGAMLAVACGAFELAARRTGSVAFRAAVGVAAAAAFILVWTTLAVGVIGDEENPANLMYGGVLAVGGLAAVIARFRPSGLARAMVATALAQASVAAIAMVAGRSPTSSAAEILALNGIFVALFLGSAGLFRRAAREQTAAIRPARRDA